MKKISKRLKKKRVEQKRNREQILSFLKGPRSPKIKKFLIFEGLLSITTTSQGLTKKKLTRIVSNKIKCIRYKYIYLTDYVMLMIMNKMDKKKVYLNIKNLTLPIDIVEMCAFCDWLFDIEIPNNLNEWETLITKKVVDVPKVVPVPKVVDVIKKPTVIQLKKVKEQNKNLINVNKKLRSEIIKLRSGIKLKRVVSEENVKVVSEENVKVVSEENVKVVSEENVKVERKKSLDNNSSLETIKSLETLETMKSLETLETITIFYNKDNLKKHEFELLMPISKNELFYKLFLFFKIDKEELEHIELCCKGQSFFYSDNEQLITKEIKEIYLKELPLL